MDWHYSVFWIVLIFKLTCGEYCLRTLETKRDVSSCPKNKQEWEAASKRMDCSEIKKTGNCEDVIYHCLRDAVTNTMVEVCTVPKNLNGFCPLFYRDPPYVRNDYHRDCSNSSMCPTFYSSKDAYNYAACYNDSSIPTTVSASEPTSSTVLNPTSAITVQNISAYGIGKETERSNNAWKWVLPLVIIFLVLIVVHISLVVWVKKRDKRISVREACCIHLYILKECRKGGQDEKGNPKDPEKDEEKLSLLSEENNEGNTGTCNKDNECDKRNINEGETYEKDVSPESEKETTFHQTDEKSPVKVDLENKSSIKSLTQKDDFTEGGTSDNKGLDTSSNNANQTSYKTTALQLRDAKEPMGSDSTEGKRDTVEGGLETTSELPQKETPQTEEKVAIAGSSVDEGNKDDECDKKNINEGGTYEKDVSPESEKETTLQQTDEKSPVEVDYKNKSCMKSLSQKDDSAKGGTSDNKGLDTSSNNANQTSDKTTVWQLADAKEPMGSDSTEDKRDPVERGLETTSELPQKESKMETPQTEEKDEGKHENPNPACGCRRKDVVEEKGKKKEASNFQKRIIDLQLRVDGLMRVMTKLCGKGRIYYAEKDISNMEVEMTLIENRSSNPMTKRNKIEEEIEKIETTLAPIEEKINELKYEVEDDEEFGMPIQESDKTQQGNMEKLDEKNPKGKESCLSGMAEMKNSLPASNEESYDMSGFSNEVVAFIVEEDKREDKQENYQKEYTNEATGKIVLKKKDPEKVKWSGNFPGNLSNEGCGDNTVTDKNPDPKQQKNPGRLEILESKIKELKEEIRQLGEDIHSVTGVGILHNIEKKIKQLNQDVTLLGSMIKGNMNNLEERIKNFEERVNQLQENINTQRENQRKIFDSVDIQKNCESDSL